MKYQPLFVLGIARSGTNLLARMLDGNPEVALALDPLLPVFRSLRNAAVKASASEGVLKRFSADSAFQDYYFDPDGPILLDLMLQADANIKLPTSELALLREKTAARAALESQFMATLMMRLDGGDYGSVLRSALDQIAGTKAGAKWVGTKELWVLEFVPLLARLFPNARFILIERDPRAIVGSLLAMAKKDPSQAAHPPSYMRHWRKQVSIADHFEKCPTLVGRFYRLNYERFVARPEEVARKLCNDLDINFMPEMLRFSDSGWQGNSSFEHGNSEVYSDTVDRWRYTLSEQAVQAVDFLCGPEMALAGYKLGSAVNPSEVLSYMVEAGLHPGSWRSDSGDLLADYGGELARQALLQCDKMPDESLVRRCFLFTDTKAAIRGVWRECKQK